MKSIIMSVPAIGLLVLILSGGCAPGEQVGPGIQSPPRVRYRIEKTQLGQVAGRVGLSEGSDDGLHVAFHLVGKNGSRLSLDGKAGPEFDDIDMFGVRFSPDGGRCAYKAKRGEKWFVVLDHRPLRETEGVGAISFSPDGRRLAYTISQGGGDAIVVDEKEIYAARDIEDLTFSPDSRRLAFVATVKGFKQRVVMDGRRVPTSTTAATWSSAPTASGSHTSRRTRTARPTDTSSWLTARSWGLTTSLTTSSTAPTAAA